MTVIRAAVCHAFGEPLRIEEVRLRPPGPGEAHVRLGAVAICHSDIAYAQGAWGGHLPAVYGHEAAGEVVAVGEGVEDLAPGTRVVVTLMRACGHCPACASGEPHICDAPYDRVHGPISALDGSPIKHGLSTGAFAEQVVVDRSQVVPIPGDLPLDQAALLACGVITGVGAVTNAARVRPGESVVVIGAGGVGLNTIQGAALSGASRIIAIDLSEDKLATAREFGATDGILASADKPHRQVRALTGGRGADAVFVTVGAIAAHQSAPRYARRGGRVVLVGMPPSGETIALEPVVLAATSQSVIGSNMGNTNIRRDIPWLVEMHRQGRLKLAELISGRWRLDQINEAIADTRAGHARRNVIVFD